ncbi:MAG TPA: methionyl-tRNA formyltransferase [Bryobacteraceae bacterium]|jgi:methionyl-tRNA formyltransferase|nr:methionyl-tRNA formyltransferase [Bryobacteraceae bacterium]
MDLIFFGTPVFAVPTLKRILETGHRVQAVITQPDRPKGRSQAVSPSPVKEAALAYGLPLFQPERIRRPEVVERLAAMKADAMVVVGYGQIIPQSIIDLPRFGIINVHGSLLPKYRGAAPIQWSIINGEKVTGVTTMRIDAGLDTGDMLLKAETAIGPEETAVELGQRLAPMGAELLVETLAGLEAGTLVPERQDSTQATLAPILKKEDGWIAWNSPAQAIHNRVRGLLPWPGAYTRFRGQTLHIWKSKLGPPAGGAPGSLRRTGRSLVAAGGDGAGLELLEIQLEGKKRMSGEAFANGQRLQENETLGDPS